MGNKRIQLHIHTRLALLIEIVSLCLPLSCHRQKSSAPDSKDYPRPVSRKKPEKVEKARQQGRQGIIQHETVDVRTGLEKGKSGKTDTDKPSSEVAEKLFSQRVDAGLLHKILGVYKAKDFRWSSSCSRFSVAGGTPLFVVCCPNSPSRIVYRALPVVLDEVHAVLFSMEGTELMSITYGGRLWTDRGYQVTSSICTSVMNNREFEKVEKIKPELFDLKTQVAALGFTSIPLPMVPRVKENISQGDSLEGKTWRLTVRELKMLQFRFATRPATLFLLKISLENRSGIAVNLIDRARMLVYMRYLDAFEFVKVNCPSKNVETTRLVHALGTLLSRWAGEDTSLTYSPIFFAADDGRQFDPIISGNSTKEGWIGVVSRQWKEIREKDCSYSLDLAALGGPIVIVGTQK